MANLAGFYFFFFFFFFFYFCLFKFGYPHTVLPCILHACTHNKFFFLGPVVQPQQCVLLYLSISLHLYVFLFLVGVFVYWVGLVVSYLVWTSLRLRNFEWILKLFTAVLGLDHLSFTYYPSFNFGIETWKKKF